MRRSWPPVRHDIPRSVGIEYLRTFLSLTMRSRILSACFSGYACGMRTSHGFAVRTTAAGCGVTRSCASASESSTLLRSPPHPAARAYHHTASARGGGGRGDTHGGSSMSSSSTAGEVEVEMGQDSGEMFDVFEPPPEGVALSALTEPPRPAGFRKARGLVHADGDWHRSVHIWLHNSKVVASTMQRVVGMLIPRVLVPCLICTAAVDPTVDDCLDSRQWSSDCQWRVKKTAVSRAGGTSRARLRQ